MDLKQWHNSFEDLLTDQISALEGVISGTDTFPAAMRLGVYRNNYHQGLVSHLSHTFERCKENVGEDYFSQLAGSYIKACPPRTQSLQDYGGRFPQHLEMLATQRPELSHLPYLPDLARLDWLCDEIYYSPQRQAWPEQSFQQLRPEQYEHIHLLMSPDCGLLSSHWPLSRIWALHRGETTRLEISYLEQPEYLLIHRDQHRICLEVLDAADYQLLEAIAKQKSLGELAGDCPDGIANLPVLISSGWIHGYSVP